MSEDALGAPVRDAHGGIRWQGLAEVSSRVGRPGCGSEVAETTRAGLF